MTTIPLSQIHDRLYSSDARVRWEMLDELRKQRSMPKEGIHWLIQALQDEAGKVRWRAAAGIRDLAPTAGESFPSLVERLGDSQQWVRWHSFDALRTMMDEAELSRTLLERILSTPDENLASNIAQRLVEIHAERYVPLPRLLRAYRCHTTPEVRPSLARLIGRYHIADPVAFRELCESLRDSDARVRVAAADALGTMPASMAPETQALHTSLMDRDVSVATAAAIALARQGCANYRSIALLTDALSGERFLDAWQAFRSISARNQFIHELGQRIDSVSQSLVRRAITEDISQGILPTIGLKIWTRELPLESPSKIQPYPFFDAGVFHSWESHAATMRQPKGIVQACFYADWFSDIHLIPLLHITLYPPHQWNGHSAPFLLEGSGIGPLLASGGHVLELPMMRNIPVPYLTNRVDVLFGSDLHLLQYLFVGGLASKTPECQRSAFDCVVADGWKQVAHRVAECFSEAGFPKLSREQWYTNDSWWSLHYKTRHETPYALIRDDMVRLFNMLKGDGGGRFQEYLRRMITPVTTPLESKLFTERLKNYPPSLLAINNVMEVVYEKTHPV